MASPLSERTRTCRDYNVRSMEKATGKLRPPDRDTIQYTWKIGLTVLCLLSAAAIVPLLLAQGMGGGPKAIARGAAKARLDLPSPKVEFRDIAAAAGLTASNIYGGVTTKKYILEMTGNGAAIFAFDNDGKPDIFLINGSRPNPPTPWHKTPCQETNNPPPPNQRN